MPKAADAITTTEETTPEETQTPPTESKFRLILVAAQRSRQLQSGAHSRVEMDTQRHKPTRVALEEVLSGAVSFSLIEKE